MAVYSTCIRVDSSETSVVEVRCYNVTINCWEVRPFFGESVVSVMLSFLRTGLFSYQLSMFHICKLETLNFLTM